MSRWITLIIYKLISQVGFLYEIICIMYNKWFRQNRIKLLWNYKLISCDYDYNEKIYFKTIKYI